MDESVSIASRFTNPQPWASLMWSVSQPTAQHAPSTICVLEEESPALPSSSPTVP